MDNLNDKYKTIQINIHINEIMAETTVIQHYKNNSTNAIDLSMVLPQLVNCIITKFEMTMGDSLIISKILSKEKAEKNYNDIISSGKFGFTSFNKDKETSIFLGNIPPNKEITLKTNYIGNLTCNDLSYQAIFPVIFPRFLIVDEKSEKLSYHKIEKKCVKGTIMISAFSKLTRLIIKGADNFDKIEKQFLRNDSYAVINFMKFNFSGKDIPGIILFRTEKMNDEILYTQYDPYKERYYFLFQKTLKIPQLTLEQKDEIDANENTKYANLLKDDEKIENNIGCYIFLIDQSGSMSGDRIYLCKKALLLFLQSLNKGSYFHLIGFGTNFSYYSQEPLEYNKQNYKIISNNIRNLEGNRGGTQLYEPLKSIFENPVYDKLNVVKHIFLLTDGEIENKETTLNLIGSYSDKFVLHSLGIGECDKDLIKRSAIMGNGNSFFIENLQDLNKNVISALAESQISNKINCTCELNHKALIEENPNKTLGINDFFRHGFILGEINNELEILLKIKKGDIYEENKISFNRSNIKEIPKGDKLGKLIVNNYLARNEETLDPDIKINLSLKYGILTSDTAFYAEIQNEKPIRKREKAATSSMSYLDNDDEDTSAYESHLDFDNTSYDKKESNKGFFSNFFNLFCCEPKCKEEKKNEIIRKKIYEKEENELDLKPQISDRKLKSHHHNIDIEKGANNRIINKINFDEIILSQDIFEGNWIQNEEINKLIEEEKNIFDKIKKISEGKNVNEENGIITLLVIYYIFDKNKEKIDELKFIINKARTYIKKIYNIELEDILEEIHSN